MVEDQERLESLEASVLALKDNVANLVYTLKVVSALTERQQLQDQAQATTEARVEEAKALANRRYRRVARIQLILGLALIVAVTVGPLIAYSALTARVNREFNTQQAQLASSCLLRNRANVEIPLKRELALAAQARLDNEPVIAKIHQDSADALRTAVVDCTIYRHKM